MMCDLHSGMKYALKLLEEIGHRAKAMGYERNFQLDMLENEIKIRIHRDIRRPIPIICKEEKLHPCKYCQRFYDV